MMLKRTSLYDQHVAAGAKLVDFGGWEMPLHYGSQIDEHHAVRRHAGMFDVSHMCVVDVQGTSSRDFLRILMANDVDKLKLFGKALYSCMLNAQGGVIDDLIVYYFGEDFFRLVINAGTAEKDLRWMQACQTQHAADVRITPRHDLAMIAVQGPQAREKFWQAQPGAAEVTSALKGFFAVPSGTLWVARTGYTGEDGFEITVPYAEASQLWQSLRAVGVQPCGLGARDTLRLEAGMNLYGNDMDENVSPLDAGLAWTVDLRGEREFIGKAALLKYGQRYQFLGLKLLDKGVMRGHQAVQTRYGPGEVTSGTFSPTLGFSIGMARLPREIQVGEQVQVEIRGKHVPALTVNMPFVRNGTVLI